MRDAGAFFKPFRDGSQPPGRGALGHPQFQFSVFFKCADRAPQGAVDAVTLGRFEPIRRILVPDMTLITDRPAVFDFPERSAAVGTRQRRWGAEMLFHL